MDWTVIIVLQVIFQPSLSDLFTVEAEQPKYMSEFGGDVVMRCSFHPVPSDTVTGLSVNWRWMKPNDHDTVREVYAMDNGKERLSSQNVDFHGRVKLNTEELQKGWAELQVSRLRINDSGTYQCLVKTGKGTDYKITTLSVMAPYKEVTKHIQETAEGDEVLLTCRSEGYPKSLVVWQDGHLQNLKPNTTSVSTPDQLIQVTSQIRVNSSDKNNYTCIFKNGGYSATFHIPDDIPLQHVKNDGLIVALSIIVIVVVIVAVVFAYKRQKGSSTQGTADLTVVECEDRSVSDAACQQRRNGNEYNKITIFSEAMDSP